MLNEYLFKNAHAIANFIAGLLYFYSSLLDYVHIIVACCILYGIQQSAVKVQQSCCKTVKTGRMYIFDTTISLIFK